MPIKYILILISVLFPYFSYSQKIKVDVEEKPLQEVLFELSELYQIQYTLNSENAVNCNITKTRSYSSPEEAISDIIISCNLSYIKRGEVYVILPIDEIATKKKFRKKYYIFIGKIVDADNSETLPSAVIKYNNKHLTTDASGSFSFKITDSIVSVNVTYLGYYEKDTSIMSNVNNRIILTPSEIQLNEVVIKSERSTINMYSGEKPANIKMNPRVAKFLPGNIDNGIYNMLRLQPGIVSAGEQIDDYTIWGSYLGQNLIQYDNITIFNVGNFDNTQSIIHPLMIKEIDVVKGGFNAEYSNRVGGIVNITGKNGDIRNYRGKLNVNNRAASGYLNVPIAKRFALQVAYRRTFDNILNFDDSFIDKNNLYFITIRYFCSFCKLCLTS